MSAVFGGGGGGGDMTEIELQTAGGNGKAVPDGEHAFGGGAEGALLSRQFSVGRTAVARHGVLFRKNMKLKMRGAIKWCTFCETIVPVAILGLLCIGTARAADGRAPPRAPRRAAG